MTPRRARGGAARTAVRLLANVDVDLWDIATGRHLARESVHNLTVTTGLNLIRDLLNGDAVAGLTHFAVGTGSTAVTIADTTLGTEVFRAAVTQKTKNTAQLVVKYYLPAGSANGNTLREAGLFNASSSGTMYVRVVFASSIVKTSSIAVTFTWTLGWT